MQAYGFHVRHVDKFPAVLDTSFWTKSCRAGVEAYIYEFFRKPIWIPIEVWKEVADPVRRRHRLYDDCLRMIQGVENDQISIVSDTVPHGTHFDEGERHCIYLAKRLGADLLIDDFKPHTYARSIGIKAVSVPQFLTVLYAYDYINRNRALRGLSSIERSTSARLIEPARRAIDAISRMRTGEREVAADHDDTY